MAHDEAVALPAVLDMAHLKAMKIVELTKIAKELGINDYYDLRKQELIFKIIEAQALKLNREQKQDGGGGGGMTLSEGVLEVLL